MPKKNLIVLSAFISVILLIYIFYGITDNNKNTGTPYKDPSKVSELNLLTTDGSAYEIMIYHGPLIKVTNDREIIKTVIEQLNNIPIRSLGLHDSVPDHSTWEYYIHIKSRSKSWSVGVYPDNYIEADIYSFFKTSDETIDVFSSLYANIPCEEKYRDE